MLQYMVYGTKQTNCDWLLWMSVNEICKKKKKSLDLSRCQIVGLAKKTSLNADQEIKEKTVRDILMT